MRSNNSKKTFAAAALAAALSLLPASLVASELEIYFFTIGAGASSGTDFLTGALLSNIVSNPPGSRACEDGGSCGVPGLIAVAQSTEGSIESMRRIAADKTDSGLGRANIVDWAHNGTWVFEGEAAMDNLRAIASLYPEELHIVVRADSGIADIAGLKGRKVALGEAQSGTRVEALLVLHQYGMTADDIEPVHATPGRAADLLETGEIDAFFQTASSPVASIAELARRVKIALLPIDEAAAIEIARAHPVFDTATILAGAYENVPQTGTLGIGTVWVTSADQDAELIYGITKALWHDRNRKLIDQGHPRALYMDKTLATRGLSIPLHPGAARYYREAGVLE